MDWPIRIHDQFKKIPNCNLALTEIWPEREHAKLGFKFYAVSSGNTKVLRQNWSKAKQPIDGLIRPPRARHYTTSSKVSR
jgi:hypothetical protein